MRKTIAMIVACGWMGSCASSPAKKAEQPAAPPPAPVAAATPAPAPTPTPPPSAPTPSPALPREPFPGVRVDLAAKTVSFDATVPIDCHNEKTPVVFLEVVCCTPDTKEHESLVLTKVKPSHVHAALLMLGLEPGKVGTWNWDGPQLTATPPTGPRLSITFSYERYGRRVESSPQDWIINIRDKRPLASQSGANGWVFSGSSIVSRAGQEWYHADREGCLIGLTCFSSETISWTQMFSPDSGVQEPVWIANAEACPVFGTPVTVTLKVP